MDVITPDGVSQAAEALGAVRANVALLLHEDGADLDDAVAYLERWSLLSHARAVKAVEFLTEDAVADTDALRSHFDLELTPLGAGLTTYLSRGARRPGP